jgi:hypothetical protein
MVDVDFTPRRVYDAVQDATAAIFVAPPGHFEETNPAIVVDTAWRGVIASEASGRVLLESDMPGASLTFTFRGHSVDLIARRGLEWGRLLVALDGRNVTGLPTDDQGRSYLDLSAPATQWQVRLPLASGLGTGQHVVRLTVSDWDPARCNIDAFEVNAGQPPAFPALPVALLGAGVVLAGIALAWDLLNRPRRERFF